MPSDFRSDAIAYRRYARPTLAMTVLAAAITTAPIAALAQTASQVTPPTFRPLASSGGVTIGTPEQAPLQAPAEATGLSVQVASVRVVGLFPELAEDAARITRRAQGRRLTVAQLYEIASAIEQLPPSLLASTLRRTSSA